MSLRLGPVLPLIAVTISVVLVFALAVAPAAVIQFRSRPVSQSPPSFGTAIDLQVPPLLCLWDIGLSLRATIFANVALTPHIIPTFPSFAEFFGLTLAQPPSSISSSPILPPSFIFKSADFLSLTNRDYRGGY